MPFTLSHAAAVLPVHRMGKHELPLTALMIGSMAPDFGYFFSHGASRALTHSFSGLFLFALPAGLAAWLFYVALLEKATITLLSDRWHTRFAHTDAITPALMLRGCIAIILGAATHLLWDAFTHRGTFITDSVPALRGPTPGLSWMPVYHLLHGVSSVAGLVILALWARRLHRQPASSSIRPYNVSERIRMKANWFLLAATLSGALLEWAPYMHRRYDVQFFSAAVGLMSGFFVAWCGVAVALLVGARRVRSGKAT
ncbi:MAG TPA: DUF4184 family protein [Steroidobacteraceae bacterium]|nr:DUF4184 family protein [Steroidobacteraceae bacterium]